jgi:hypothetical protein
MQNFFEQELLKLFANSAVIEDLRIAGRAAVGRLSSELNVKLKFVTTGTYAHYEGVEAAIINRREGKIDSTTFRFADILGRVSVTSSSGRQDTMFPYIWEQTEKTDWYRYKPSHADYAALTDAIDGYLELFQEPTQTLEMRRQTM